MVYTFPDRPNFRDTRLMETIGSNTPTTSRQRGLRKEARSQAWKARTRHPEEGPPKEPHQQVLVVYVLRHPLLYTAGPRNLYDLIVALIFVVCGGLIAELLRIISGYF